MAVLVAALWVECLLGLAFALTLGRYSLAGWTGRCHNTCTVCVLAGTWCSRLHSLVSGNFYNRHRTADCRSCSTDTGPWVVCRCGRVLGTDRDSFHNLSSTCSHCRDVDRLDIHRYSCWWIVDSLGNKCRFLPLRESLSLCRSCRRDWLLDTCNFSPDNGRLDTWCSPYQPIFTVTS